MSKAAKISIFLLIFVIVAFGALSFLTLQKNTQLTQQKAKLQQNLDEAQDRNVQAMRQIKDLNDQVKRAQSEKIDLAAKLKEATVKADNLTQQVQQIQADRDQWKRRIDKISEERDSLKQKVEDYQNRVAQLQTSVQQKDTRLAQLSKQSSPASQSSATALGMSTQMGSASSGGENDQYWAGILKQKAELQVKLDHMDDELSKKTIELVDVKKQNESLNIEIKDLQSKQDSLSDEIKYKSDLVNNLSLELARTKNDRKFVADKLSKLNEENAELRRDMKRLVSAKGALQKSIVRLTQDKHKTEKELGKTESMVQSKIDEIWKIKDSLDQTFKENAQTQPTSKDIELPPIHVNAKGAQAYSMDTTPTGFNGRIVSINEENNFVIVDIGKNKGLQEGQTLSVYRGEKYIASLEVIQVRNDISAADVKDQWSHIQVGDIVR